ncbi:ABC-2 type transport system permease protein [Saccharothrix tamanrassetensis]|uniref:ABC-2 type transport system permease protein n=1 Tax=Saccharothrix tamanrassetensis TaxID=1051531 RepID=A0A841CGY8_9PSEU|nr:ABC transporter permease [Saccharothrix tamanrassetensis]MBB5955285.1 ABC-2 type transport system permease protein [Saccharothrix tamanrassetensis]
MVHAEWIKIRTQRAVWWTLVGCTVPTMALVVGLALAGGPATASATGGPVGALLAPVATALVLTQIGVAVIGALFASNEFSHGMIRSSLLMAPRRLRFLAAKLAVIGGFGFVLGVVLASTAVVLTAGFHRDAELFGLLPDAAVVRAVLGSGLYLGTLGVFGTAVAVLMRHTAGVVLTMVAVVYVLPLIVFPLVSGPASTLGEYWPTVIGLSVVLPEGVSDVDPWLGWAVFAVQTAVVVVVSAAVFNRRDAR